jgi:hypothetical protein
MVDMPRRRVEVSHLTAEHSLASSRARPVRRSGGGPLVGGDAAASLNIAAGPITSMQNRGWKTIISEKWIYLAPWLFTRLLYLGIFAASLYLEDGSLSYTLCMLEGT